MATEALSFREDIGELSGLLTHDSTITDLTEDRLDILQREFVRKVGVWPSAQKIYQGKHREWFAPWTVSGAPPWNDEISQSNDNKKLVDFVNSWDVENIILRIRFSQLMRFGGRISNRLSDLRKAMHEEEGENVDISADSLRAVFSFLKRHPNIRYPETTLTPNGNVYSRWKGDKGALFSVEFLPDFKVGYVVFAPNPRHHGELSRNSGTDFVDTVFEKINAAFGISTWVME